MNNEINLLPDKTKQASRFLKKREMLHMTSIGILFLVSFLSITLFILIALSPLPSLRQREKDEAKRLSFFNEMIVKILLTKDRITQIKRLFETRLVYSNTLEIVKKHLPPNVLIEEIHTDQKTILVTVTSNSLSPLDQFIGDIVQFNRNEKTFKKIKLISLEQDFEKGKFILTLELV